MLKPSLDRTMPWHRHQSAGSEDSVLDVEFERVQQMASKSEAISTDEAIPESEKTLLDLVLEADPESSQVNVPFCDAEQHFVNCRLAITTELDGVVYGIGVPFDHAVIVTVEQTDGTILAMDPDDDENTELLEIMAGALAKYLGEDLKLKRTPQVLTIEGDLDQYIKDWKTDIFGQPIDAETLLDDSDDSTESFFDFMKAELGEEEFQKTLEEDFGLNDLDDINPALRALFDIPGLGTASDDVEGIKDIFSNLGNIDEESLEAPFKSISTDIDHEGTALKLVGFNFKNGNVYSLVKPFKPYTLVGKKSDDEDDLRFNLLTIEESKLVVPRLQNICRAALKKVGIELPDKYMSRGRKSQ